MTIRLSLTVLAVAAVSAASSPARVDRAVTALPASDSAIAEFEAGRFWHSTRILRAEGSEDGEPADVLLLARAEAGWNNWPAVESLLADADWLEDEGRGGGLYLLGRAQEDAGMWRAAAVSYEAYGLLTPAAERRHQAAAVRRIRSLWKVDERSQALVGIRILAQVPAAASWIALELARQVAEVGDLDALESLLVHVRDPLALDALWRIRADALVEAGDSASAAAAFEAIRIGADGRRRAIATVELGRLRLAAGDTTEARPLLREGFEDAPRMSQALAAASLSDMGGSNRELTLRIARLLDRSGDGRRGLRGYDRVMAMSREEGVEPPLSMRVERARLMGTVRVRQEAAIEEFRVIRVEVDEVSVGARNLELWAQLRRRQGLTNQVGTLRRWLIEEYPSSSQAAEILWSRANAADTRGSVDSALGQYAFLAENAGSHARAGQARMRSGQIHLARSDLASAVLVYEQYLADFPSGRKWQEASYWAGRARLELGDTAAARAHIDRLWVGDLVSYYSVMGADLLSVEYEMDLPEVDAPPAPPWLADGLARLDLFTEADLTSAASAEIGRLTELARSSPHAMLSLAEALIERGRTIDGINLGWALRDDGQEWDARLIRVAFPFPYSELVRREAEEWGLDPITMAAIIRQESAFKADIVSRAGAIGLMQVMPPTGAQFARAHGPTGFHPANLTAPEVNLHLGAAFFVDMSARYDDDLPLVLSAYNAGPTRATRWRRYPEVSDPLRFTERIPFAETRGYVKNVRRNLGLYRVLYGQD
jgi:soluble lytic murein transglycosylase